MAVIIHLGYASPHTSSNLPGDNADHVSLPCNSSLYLVLLRVGFTLPLLLLTARCAFTTPFHPYHRLPQETLRRYIFCGTCRRLTPPRRYLALYPMEPGLSSPCREVRSDHPANSGHSLEYMPLICKLLYQSIGPKVLDEIRPLSDET